MGSYDARSVRLGSALSPDVLGQILYASPGPEMEGVFLRQVFPSLRMEQWIGAMLSELGPGEVTSYSALASAMGEKKAARAVGEVLSIGIVPGSHRVVHSDGRVPPRSKEMLSTELDIPSGAVRPETMVSFRTEDPPFPILKDIQSGMETVPFERVNPGPLIAGMDISCDHSRSAAAFCLTDPSGGQLGGTSIGGDLAFPYVPGYLFYRETPLLIPLLHRARDEGLMEGQPLILIDGNGMLHPRRMGIAIQLGIICSVPTCGVAKRLLLGSVGEWTAGSAPVMVGGQRLGTALRKGDGKAFYVSEGSGPGSDDCIERVRSCLIGSLPEPLLLAHRSSNEARRAQKP